MLAHVQARTTLRAPANHVWELLLRKDTFLYITCGMMTYADSELWPARLFTEGEVLKTQVSLFGWGPFLHHEVNVVRVDEAERQIATEENGGFIRVWNHRMRIEPVSESECRYTDRIDLNAGLFTPFVWLFASIFYRYRQRRWQRWLAITSTDCVKGARIGR